MKIYLHLYDIKCDMTYGQILSRPSDIYIIHSKTNIVYINTHTNSNERILFQTLDPKEFNEYMQNFLSITMV